MTRIVEIEQTHRGITIRRVREGNSRFYEIQGAWPELEGKKLPGTTNITGMLHKPALVPWANRIGREAIVEFLTPYIGRELPANVLEHALIEAKDRPEKVKKEAGNFGTRAHALIETIIKGGEVEIPDDLRPCIDSFYAWYENHGQGLELSEVLACHPMGYCTQIDGVVRQDGYTDIVNFKTGKGPYLEHALQVAAEAAAYERTTDQRVHKAWVVRLWQDEARFEAYALSPFTRPWAFEMFHMLLITYGIEQRFGDKMWEESAHIIGGKP